MIIDLSFRALWALNLDVESLVRGLGHLSVSAAGITFIDSFNFLMEPLAKQKERFKLHSRFSKGYFPHNFLRADTLNYMGPFPSNLELFQSFNDSPAQVLEKQAHAHSITE